MNGTRELPGRIPARPLLMERLEHLYRLINRPEYIAPDPLEIVLSYPDPADREVVGLLVAGLSYGRVQSILQGRRKLLEPMGSSPARFCRDATGLQLDRLFQGFRYRWTTGDEVAALVLAMGRLLKRHRSLETAFARHLGPADRNILAALGSWVQELGVTGSLVPDPRRKGACKRLHMYLRWMVRRDPVDPGGWSSVSPAQLIMPLDVHSFRLCRRLRLTRARTPSGAAAIAITRAFATFRPDDPVRYDFCLTRIGIHPGGIDGWRVLGG